MQFFKDVCEKGTKTRMTVLKGGNEYNEYHNWIAEPCEDLFKPYSTDSVGAFFWDLTVQLVWNPICTLLTNIFLTLITPWDIIKTTWMTILGSDDDDYDFYDLAICWAGLMYFPIHAVVDPLWELLASVTRLMGAFGGGLPAACNWLEDTPVRRF